MSRFALKPVMVKEVDFEGWVDGSADEITPGVTYPVWLDTPTGFLLTRKGRPQAVAGIALSAYSSEVMMYQLQGIQGRRAAADETAKEERITSGGLTGLDWRKVMIGATEHVAQAMGVETIAVRQGSKNGWARHRWQEPRT